MIAPPTLMVTTLSARMLEGAEVHNPDGEDLGRIEDLMIDVPQGRIAYGVLSFGGVLGFGEKHFAIPWQRLQFDPKAQAFTLDVTKEALERAPLYESEGGPERHDYRWIGRLYEHYGIRPYW